MDRWIIYCAGTLRLHKFYSGDDERAPHDHPWWFITFPFRSYTEVVPRGGVLMYNRVRRLLFHFRPATYRHYVVNVVKPFYTVVITGSRSRCWGFWPSDKEFIYWRKWV